MTKHTPGPYHLEPAPTVENYHRRYIVHGENVPYHPVRGARVAIVIGKNAAEADANAELFVQAPQLLEQRDELLAACESLLPIAQLAFTKILSTIEPGGTSPAIDKARAAIAKAKGE